MQGVGNSNIDELLLAVSMSACTGVNTRKNDV